MVKPVTFDRFLKAVDKIIKSARIKHKEITAETSSIFLKVDRRLIKVDFSKILYIQGMGDYLKVHAIKKHILPT